jgi:hypothetical protein
MLDLSTPGHTDVGFYSIETLPADTLITITRDGVDVGTVKFADVKSRSHCKCPTHGGSGRGSAWVDRTPQGVRLRCSRCRKMWQPETVVKPIDPAVLAAIKAEEAAENDACDRRRKYVESFADRVAVRYEAAAIYDLLPEADHPRTPGEQAEADNAQAILTAAKRAVQYARDLAPHLRARWAAAGLVHRREGCGGLPQGLVDYTTGDGLHVGRVCGRDDCAYCGPWRVALRAGAVLQMPVLDPEGRIAGAPMGLRDVWRFRIDRTRLEAWQAAFGRELRPSRKSCKPTLLDACEPPDSPADAEGTGIDVLDLLDAREPSVGDSGSSNQKILCTGISDTSARPGEAYVVFDAGIGDKVTVLSTLPLQRSRKFRAFARLVPRQCFESAVLALVNATWKPERDDLVPCLVRMHGSMRAGHGLHLDPEIVSKRARPHGWCLATRDVCSVREGVTRARQRGEHPRVVRAEDGVITAVRFDAREPGEWQALWHDLARRAVEPEPDIDETDEVPVVWDEPDPDAVEAAGAALDAGGGSGA